MPSNRETYWCTRSSFTQVSKSDICGSLVCRELFHLGRQSGECDELCLWFVDSIELTVAKYVIDQERILISAYELTVGNKAYL